jgi:hypothetical protein
MNQKPTVDTISRVLMVVASVLFITGCAGTAVRKDSADIPAAAGVLKVKSVDVHTSPKVKEQLPDNIKFDPTAFSATIERTLTASGLEEGGSGNTLDIEITNVYVRGTFSAVMFGILAGADNVAGNVRVQDASGRVLRKFEISAGYGFGGWGGGQDSIRLNYLYEKFAELTRDQLRDQK